MQPITFIFLKKRKKLTIHSGAVRFGTVRYGTVRSGSESILSTTRPVCSTIVKPTYHSSLLEEDTDLPPRRGRLALGLAFLVLPAQLPKRKIEQAWIIRQTAVINRPLPSPKVKSAIPCTSNQQPRITKRKRHASYKLRVPHAPSQNSTTTPPRRANNWGGPVWCETITQTSTAASFMVTTLVGI